METTAEEIVDMARRLVDLEFAAVKDSPDDRLRALGFLQNLIARYDAQLPPPKSLARMLYRTALNVPKGESIVAVVSKWIDERTMELVKAAETGHMRTSIGGTYPMQFSFDRFRQEVARQLERWGFEVGAANGGGLRDEPHFTIEVSWDFKRWG